MLPHDEHIMTRTYGAKGRLTKAADAGKPFREVLETDIDDIKHLFGDKYDEGIEQLRDYYRKTTPNYTEKTSMIRSEIRDLERLGPLPTDDDDYPGIDQKLLDFELCLANIDPPITMEEARTLASLFPEDGGTSYGLAWSLVHLIGTLNIDEYKEIIPEIRSEEWRDDFKQWMKNEETKGWRNEDNLGVSK